MRRRRSLRNRQLGRRLDLHGRLLPALGGDEQVAHRYHEEPEERPLSLDRSRRPAVGDRTQSARRSSAPDGGR